MPIEIIHNDMTKVHADATLNIIKSSLLRGGRVDRGIHQGAGPEILAEYHTLADCKVGQAKITKGYKLSAKYVIHAVVPVWHDGESNEINLLADCYKNSLALAKEYKLESIALPLISSGEYGFPKDKALKTVISVIEDFLLSNDMMIFLVVHNKESFSFSEKLFSSIAQYIDDRYIEEIYLDFNKTFDERQEINANIFILPDKKANDIKIKRSLEDLVKNVDETFTLMLLRLIDEKGMTDVGTYKNANIDRKLFSKIRNDINYKPSKPTAIAFAIALMLNLDETKDLLLRAGYALSHSSKFDIIIEYFIKDGNYKIYEINEALFAFDQNLLGA